MLAVAGVCTLLVVYLHFWEESVKGKYMELARTWVLALSPEGFLHNLRRLLGFWVVTALLLFFGLRRAWGQRLAQAILPLVLVVDVAGNQPYALNTYDPEVLRKVPLNLQIVQSEAGLFRVYKDIPGRMQAEFFRKVEDPANLLLIATDCFIRNAPMRYGIFQASGFRVLTLKRVDQVIRILRRNQQPDDTRLLDFLNVRYVLWKDPVESPGYTLIRDSGACRLYRNQGALPRALLVPGYRVMRDEQESLQALQDPTWDPRMTVFLEQEPEFPEEAEGRIRESGGSYPIGRVKFLDYQPERIVLEAQLETPGFLVLSEAYYPGWRVTVDGQPHRILRANFAFRAVPLTSGTHRVVFLYDPWSVKVGSWLSLASTVGLGVWGVTSWRRRRKP